jgi:deoxyadenosine/deoxycytidine kinase
MILWLIVVVLIVVIYIKFAINKKKVIVSIEGNIGVGKSTLLNILRKELDADFLDEPVKEWEAIQDTEGKNILQTYYENIPRWSYTFQNITYITRLKHIVNLIENSRKRFMVLDRSLLADLNIFGQMLYDTGNLNQIEWKCYNLWNNFFETFYGHRVVQKIVYLRCNPDIAYMRMQLRARESEKSVSFEYLKTIHQYHEKWLMDNHNDVLVIDGNKDFIKNKTRQQEVCALIKDFIKNK